SSTPSARAPRPWRARSPSRTRSRSPAAATPWRRWTSTVSPATSATSPPAAARSWRSWKASSCRRWPRSSCAARSARPPDAPACAPALCARFPGQYRETDVTTHQRRTRILATLGPASDAPGVIDDLLRAGVDAVRLNFSHGDREEHRARARAVREAAARLGKEVGILADLPGPKIRIDRFEGGRVELRAGQRFDLVADGSVALGNEREVGVSYPDLPRDLGVGDVLLLDDGIVQLRVESIEGARIVTTVINDYPLSDRKGLNRLGGGLSLGALTDDDRASIAFAAELGVDSIAVSFCRSAADMREARKLARAAGSDASMVSKIERAEAIANLAGIIDASDVVMVARG